MPKRQERYQPGTPCELPGGEDDAGLMESDLMLLFKDLIDMAHPDLSKKEIHDAFKAVLEDRVVNLGNCVGIRQKRGKGDPSEPGHPDNPRSTYNVK